MPVARSRLRIGPALSNLPRCEARLLAVAKSGLRVGTALVTAAEWVPGPATQISAAYVSAGSLVGKEPRMTTRSQCSWSASRVRRILGSS